MFAAAQNVPRERYLISTSKTDPAVAALIEVFLSTT